ncbi:MAG TPA: serine protease [Thermoanaerobaculia bacterium]|nr:serine protease [Thermoanaerobaculia bacterium]
MYIDPTTPQSIVYTYDYGSGVLLAGNGWILTAQHLLGGDRGIDLAEPRITILTAFSSGYVPVDLLATDESADLALLQANPRALPSQTGLQLRTEPPLREGEVLYSLGIRAAAAPLDFEVGLIRGRSVVADPALTRLARSAQWSKNSITISQQIFPGYSGGPILDSEGSLVGVILGAPITNGQWGGYSYGVAATAIAEFLDSVAARSTGLNEG